MSRDSDTPAPGRPAASTGVGFSWRDALALGAFAIFAALFHLGRWQGADPFLFLYGDAANIASFAAGRDFPGLFAGDPVLGDASHTRHYATLHIPLLRALAPHFGGYGGAFVSLLGLHVFIQAAGFYLLGRVLFRRPSWAFLLACATLPPVWINLGTYWGVFSDPQPRFGFQALLPFVLAAAIAWRDKPARWPLLMAMAGALMYVHPVSAPAWGFALWLGLWGARPSGWSIGRQTLVMGGLGGLFLVVCAPFVINYLLANPQGTSPTLPYETVFPVFEGSLGRAYLNVDVAVREFASLWWEPLGLYWVWAAAGAFWLVRAAPAERSSVLTMGLWMVGLLVVCVVLPAFDQGIARARRALPLEIDLVRGIRYLVPLMLTLGLWPLAILHARAMERSAPRSRVAAPLLAGVLFTGIWVAAHPPLHVGDAVACLARGKMYCPPAGWAAVAEAMAAVRERTPEGTKILATAYELQVRHNALRSVVHTPHDLGAFAYTDPGGLLDWKATQARLRRVSQLAGGEAKFRELLAIARDLGADYVLADARYFARHAPRMQRRYLGQEVVFSNGTFALIRLADAPEL